MLLKAQKHFSKESENPELYEVMNYIGCVTSLLT